MEDVLVSYSCFIIRKVSHHGTLSLTKTQIKFNFSSGEEEEVVIKLSDVSSVNVEKHLVGAVSNLAIQTEEETFFFSGVHEADTIKDYITLLQSQLEKVSPSYGFVSEASEEEQVKWTPLANPVMLVSSSIPAPMATVRQIVENPQSYFDLYSSIGNEDIKISEWEQNSGYRERTIEYMKLVIMPVLGKNLIHVIEYQRLFELDGGFGIHVISDLGKTPYADCFDPFVQIIIMDKGETTDLTVNLEIVWSSQPFVKSIIESQTSGNIKELYFKWVKDISKSVGADDADTQEDKNENENAGEDKFLKTKMIYKIAIIVLSVILIGLYTWRVWPKGGVKYSKKVLYQILCFAFFLFVLTIM